MNLLVVTVLDNFSNLASMDENYFGPDDLDAFAHAWHNMTYDAVFLVDQEAVGIEITDLMVETMTDDELHELFEEKVQREERLRLKQWAEFRSLFESKPYFPDSGFYGWLHRPNAVAMLTQGLVRVRDFRYFWIDSDCTEEVNDQTQPHTLISFCQAAAFEIVG